jgi:acylphosphatase
MSAVSQARGLQVHGYVRNEPDGSVLMDVEGPEPDVKELMRRIQATMSDNIEDTITDSRDTSGANGGFTIRY